MLEQYVIYKNPKDHPDKFVLRKWVIVDGNVQPGECLAVTKSKEEALKALPPGLVRMERQPDDAPVIEEVWI